MTRGHALQPGDRVRVERSFGGDNLVGQEGTVRRLRAMNGQQYALVDLAALAIWIRLADLTRIDTAAIEVAS